MLYVDSIAAVLAVQSTALVPTTVACLDILLAIMQHTGSCSKPACPWLHY
jgi:hypothetical protein